LRAAPGDGVEGWDDLLLGPRTGPVAPDGDLLVRDRNGNWTYALCVVVDDLRHGVDLVVRGEDLVEATAVQIRLGRLLGREDPPAFAHHPLVRRPDGSKLSKADGATSIGELLDAGATPAELIGRAAAAVGLLAEPRRVSWREAIRLVAEAAQRS
jgi:glutamyl/glutaminyl-tRNA synthetase